MLLLITILISIILAIAYQLITLIWPAQIQAAIAYERAKLVKAIAELNGNAFLEGKIKGDSSLHNGLYRLFLGVLCGDIELDFQMVKVDLRWNEELERDTKKINDEINSLGPKSKEAIKSAMYNSTKILFLRSPFLGVILLFRYIDSQLNYRKSMVKTAEHLIIKSEKTKLGYCSV